MSDKQFNNYPMVRSFNQDDSFKPRDVFFKYLYHWPLFLLFIAVSLSIALVYLKLAKPVYEIKATLLIKEDNNNNSAKAGPVLQELDIASSNKVVDNEIEVLKSRNLISQVVEDLQLWLDYQSNEKIGKENLYGKSPVKLTLLTSNNSLAGKDIIIYIKDSKTFYLTKGKEEPQAYPFNTILKGSFGAWKLEPTSHLKNYTGKSILVSVKDFEKVCDEYQKDIDVSLLNKKSPTIGLSVKDAIKQRGKDILNHLIAIYNTATITEKNRITQSTINFIDNRLASLSEELKGVEEQSEGFRSSRGLTDITSESKIYLENAQANDAKLNEVNVKLKVITDIENYIKSSTTSIRNIPSTLGFDDPGLNNLVNKLTQLELEKGRLLATTPENNPIFDPLNKQIRSTKILIVNNISSIKSSLLSSKEKLESLGSGFKSSIRNIPGLERQLIGINRQQNIKEDLFLYLLKKREEISLSYASTLADARIIDSAYAGPIKWPNKLLILAIALMAGLGLPVAILVIRKLFNDKITGRKDIETATNAPVIGEIKHVDYRSPIIVIDEANIAAREQFRFLATKLLLLHKNKREQGRITLLASSIAKEGKTFISANLALSLAASGKKVILIDLDLRQTKIAKIFKLKPASADLSGFLQKGINLEAVIRPSGLHPNLDIIANDKIVINSSELIGQAQLEKLFNSLRISYDDIILVAPPFKLVADALIVSQFSAVTLYIVRQNFTRKGFLPFINSLYRDQDIDNMNIIINGVTRDYSEKDFGKGYYPKIKAKQNRSLLKQFKNFLKRF